MGGKDISPEGLQVCLHHLVLPPARTDSGSSLLKRGYSHSFVFEFSSIADRDYYIKNDPAHMTFGAYITGMVQDVVMVTDFIPGEF